MLILGCSFFAYGWKLPAYNGAFLLTIENFCLFILTWRFFLQPQPPHTRQKYEQAGPQTAEFALFRSIWGHILSRFLFIFLPCMPGAGVTGVFLITVGAFLLTVGKCV